ncbi:50S ribosomal protein L20 [Botrimarina colliarenosi]|uniref:Large ribosomal subunit protein bL20 n=1 Tax=Botrimarina colliarenosi TaxID=2528001 RepID=A0A5C6AMQ9_9BACT|nr:50S ribosomal protein L20 [Botrimarina colliarenosi]TWU00701.1 50S ribosomal protein L20 [Botrimarina colliarenosi]
MRTTNGASRHQRKKRLFKAAKGNVGARSKCIRTVKETLVRSGAYSYRDRKVRAREFRRLWITRLNAACRQRGRRYSEFINALNTLEIALDRKSLSEMAIHDPAAFDVVFAQCETHMKKKDDERAAQVAADHKAREAVAV